MGKKQIVDIHLEFDADGHVEKMSIVQDGKDKINILSNQNVGFNTATPQHKLVVEDCRVGIGDPLGSLPEILHIEGEKIAGARVSPKIVLSVKEDGSVELQKVPMLASTFL